MTGTPSLRTLIFAVLCGVLCLSPAACGSDTVIALDIPKDATHLQQAAAAVHALQTWYSHDTGLYAAPAGWWNAANAITAIVNYERVANDRSLVPVIANTFTAAQSGSTGHPNFTNKYFDDTGWWGLAWIDAYDLTGNSAYLSMAETTFLYMTTAWDTQTCGGGVWWNTDRKYKNAITNELFLDMAAKLANRTTGPTSAGYLKWAQNEWAWFQSSHMINASSLINDGLDSTNPAACVNNQKTTWTYNQGVILGGLVELAQATSDHTLLTQAQSIANAVLAPSSPLLTPNGILVDRTVNGGDTPQFKGIFLRNLMALYAAAPTPQYKTFADANATSLWTSDNSAARFGGLWQGPVDSLDATRQTSALDAFVAAASMN